jgi:hypothetical protein
MLSKIEHLSSSEQQLILNAPVLISALISGADGDFAPEEIAQAVKIIHIKTYSETRDVSGVYKYVVVNIIYDFYQIVIVLHEYKIEITN